MEEWQEAEDELEEREQYHGPHPWGWPMHVIPGTHLSPPRLEDQKAYIADLVQREQEVAFLDSYGPCCNTYTHTAWCPFSRSNQPTSPRNSSAELT